MLWLLLCTALAPPPWRGLVAGWRQIAPLVILFQDLYRDERRYF